jgi:hypothetical protein
MVESLPKNPYDVSSPELSKLEDDMTQLKLEKIHSVNKKIYIYEASEAREEIELCMQNSIGLLEQLQSINSEVIQPHPTLKPKYKQLVQKNNVILSDMQEKLTVYLAMAVNNLGLQALSPTKPAKPAMAPPSPGPKREQEEPVERL